MRAAIALLALLTCAHAFAACGGADLPPPPPAPPLGGTAPATSKSSNDRAAPPLATNLAFDADYRQLLERMVTVDTSHGSETKLLEPIAALYRDAGVQVQILESAPGRGNLVARLKGSGAKKPLLLLAHVDVVPIDGQPWTVAPFALTDKDGFLWGRGVNDDKSMAAAIVAVTLELARAHTPLTRDIIVALTAGEETGGSAGARWLVENHKDLLDAAVALNEGGGTLVTDDFEKPVEVSVQVSEKVFQSFRLVVKGKGGHSSRPPTSGDPVVALARALVKVGEYRFPAKVLPETKADFGTQLATAEAQYRLALTHAVASAPAIAPADEATLSKDAGYNAAIRTTCVTTMLKGSPQDNVLPTSAEATVNCRILPGESIANVHAQLDKVIGDANVTVSETEPFGDGPPSPFEGEVVDAVKKVAAEKLPSTPVVPGMSTGGTDSRWLRKIGVLAYGVSPNMSSRTEGKNGRIAHGPDERKPIKLLQPGADFFRAIVRELAL
jgi:acetylornithine deacetylase/succinyl-diaminopimelate desuccinylase-like protein